MTDTTPDPSDTLAGLQNTSLTIASGTLEGVTDEQFAALEAGATHGPGPYGDGEEEETPAPEIDLTNEFFVGFQMGVIRPGHYPVFSTKQQAWRFAAYVLTTAEVLPDDETQPFTFDEYLTALKNT